jgi:exonuclease SbcD
LVQVGTLPWIVRSGLLSRQEYKNKSLQDLTQIMLARVESILNGKSGLVSTLKPDVPHILVAHGSVQGAVYGSERTVMLGHDLVWPLSLFKNEYWDYVALGHIHRHQALEDDQFPPVVYPGSVERIDFGEEREDKGFVIAQVGQNECTWEFHKLDTRHFVTVRVEADGQDPTAQVIDAIERAPVQGAVVRVIIQTTPEQNPLINEKEIERALGDAFYIASITRNVTRSERVRLGSQQDIAGMTPIQVLERYLQTKQTPPERIELLKQHAEMLSTAVKE